MDRIGRHNGVRIALALSFFSILLLSLILSPTMAWPFVFIFGIAYGTYQTVYFALAMKYTDKRIAASMFSILMAVTNIAQGAGMAMTGIFADNIGFRYTFIIVTFINLIALPLLPVVFAKENDTN